LSSGIAHEIRNPLNFLSLSIGHIKERILEEKIHDKDDLSKLLDDLIKEIHKVNDLIHNFLFLGKPITLRKEWVIPGTMINEVLYLVKDKVRKGIDVKLRCDDGQPIYCDSEYIRLCIMNLLMNAIQAIEDSGEIIIGCGKDNGFSYISVSDTGTGISEEDKAKVFEPYYSTKKFGIGIGLAISKRFIEEHGGSIVIESEIGKGTTMQLRIPDNEA
jgi:signal transduction histidine kinase